MINTKYLTLFPNTTSPKKYFTPTSTTITVMVDQFHSQLPCPRHSCWLHLWKTNSLMEFSNEQFFLQLSSCKTFHYLRLISKWRSFHADSLTIGSKHPDTTVTTSNLQHYITLLEQWLTKNRISAFPQKSSITFNPGQIRVQLTSSITLKGQTRQLSNTNHFRHNTQSIHSPHQ